MMPMPPGDQPPIQPEDVGIEITPDTPLQEVPLSEIRPVLAQVEDYVRIYWHDPRYCVQFLLGFLQLLRDEEATVESITTVDIARIKPVTDLL